LPRVFGLRRDRFRQKTIPGSPSLASRISVPRCSIGTLKCGLLTFSNLEITPDTTKDLLDEIRIENQPIAAAIAAALTSNEGR